MEHVIDATNQKLGRLASHVAQILQGKFSPDYLPHNPGKDRVVIKNVSQLVVTGRKAEQKIYYRHTGYMGHLRERVYKEYFAKSPDEIFRIAVRKMLPQNYLKQNRLNRLVIEK